MQRELFRIIDANYNRAREGMRVCEDILRFALNKTKFSLELKKSRRSLSILIESLGRDMLIKSRDTAMDNAKFRYSSGRKSDYSDILGFNFKRTT
ncbi:MAG: thiamine phosphate synthase, partial [Candidatus Omnitrophica bacterium]|nr:thiamine phosphate synthase [Candidatus Omnitrophota bacterium]